MNLDADIIHRIEQLLKQKDLVLFMKGNKRQPRCGFSAAVVQILHQLSADYLDIDVLQDPVLRESIKEYSNWPTIPQLYYQGALLGGCDIVRQLHETGELAAMIGHTSKQSNFPDTSAKDALMSPSLDLGSKEKPEKVHLPIAHGSDGLFVQSVQTVRQVKQMTVKQLQLLFQEGKTFSLYDVRTAEERAIAQIPGSLLLTAEAKQALLLRPKDDVLVFHCHHGVRSQAAAEFYVQQGFQQVWNLQDGIDAWSVHIDPKVRRY